MHDIRVTSSHIRVIVRTWQWTEVTQAAVRSYKHLTGRPLWSNTQASGPRPQWSCVPLLHWGGWCLLQLQGWWTLESREYDITSERTFQWRGQVASQGGQQDFSNRLYHCFCDCLLESRHMFGRLWSQAFFQWRKHWVKVHVTFKGSQTNQKKLRAANGQINLGLFISAGKGGELCQAK